MEELKAAVLGKWLNIDLDFIANKMGFAESEVTVSEELVYETIRCLDYETCVSEKTINKLCYNCYCTYVGVY